MHVSSFGYLLYIQNIAYYVDGEGTVTASSLYRTLGRDLTATVIHQLLAAVTGGEENDLMNEATEVPGLKKRQVHFLLSNH